MLALPQMTICKCIGVDMSKTKVNKLVRDKIPNILIKEGKAFKASHVQFNGSFRKELARKLVEEAGETLECVNWFDHLSEVEPMSDSECDHHIARITEEMGDLLEAFITLAKSYNISTNQLFAAVEAKRARFGKYDDGIFLEWVEDKKEK